MGRLQAALQLRADHVIRVTQRFLNEDAEPNFGRAVLAFSHFS